MIVKMKHELPPITDTGVLPFPHFPTRMQCFLFRNWEMIEPAVLASVLGCDTDTVCALAAEMGLDPAPAVDPAWLSKGYITVIRANWHLCSYEQLAKLLGWDTEHLAFILREDDFLSVKLGNSKPALPPLTYVPLTEKEHAETEKIRDCVERAKAFLPEHPAKPFDFRKKFAAAVRDPMKIGNPRFENRIVYSYCALYGDTFADRALLDESFPDELLAAYRSLGITGVWTQAVLYTLVPYPFDAALSRGWENRLDGMRYLTEKLKKYGIRLFLYLNEPRAMPDAFFDAHPDLRGHGCDGYASLCISTKEVREYLYNAANTLCREVPGLGGFITITASENLTNCYSRSGVGRCLCPRCREKSPAEILALTNRCLYEGAHAADENVRLIAWNWGWSGCGQKDITHAALDLMPAGISAMCVSEEGVTKEIGGVMTSVIDYSISVEGPGEYALDTWAYAKKTGHGAYAKLQLGNTWEMAAVPCVPAFEKIRKHLERIAETGNVDGAMLGWTLGGFPSPTLRLAQCFYDADRPLPDAETVYGTLFPDADIPALTAAFEKLSDAFDAFPFSVAVAYYAPQLYGSSNLLYERKTGYHASMVGNPYDDLLGWQGVFPENVFLDQLKKLSDGWDAGCRLLERAAGNAPSGDLADLVRWTRVCACHFRSMYDQSLFVQKRDRDGIVDTEIVREERRLAETMLTLAGEDPTVGYESSNHYFFTKNTLLEKLLNCDDLISRYQDRESERNVCAL